MTCVCAETTLSLKGPAARRSTPSGVCGKPQPNSHSPNQRGRRPGLLETVEDLFQIEKHNVAFKKSFQNTGQEIIRIPVCRNVIIQC